MGDIRGMQDSEFDFVFNQAAASALSLELRTTATLLEDELSQRRRLRDDARRTWRGRYGDEFDDRVTMCCDNGKQFVDAFRSTADDLDEMARLAAAELERRELARNWQERQERDRVGNTGVRPVDAGLDKAWGAWDTVRDGIRGEDDDPPPPPPTDPPRISMLPPAVHPRETPTPASVAHHPNCGVSSADPDDLEDWSAASRTLNDLMTTRKADLSERNAEFARRLEWGGFEITSLLDGFANWLKWNVTDTAWVDVIARGFRDAGCAGVAVPDAVLAAMLVDAQLNMPREWASFDSPRVWGQPLTSGYANDPVNTVSGNFVETEVDLVVGGLGHLLGLTRTYNSRSDRVGPFGPGWSSLASTRLGSAPDGAHWVGPDGQEVVVRRLPGDGDAAEPAGEYQREAGLIGRVVVKGDGLTLLAPGGERFVFDAAGLPAWRVQGPGTRVQFTHDDGRLVELAHQSGRAVRFEWNDAGTRIVRAACSDGRALTYHYDESGHLVAVDGGPRGRRAYEIGESGRIVSVTDADGVVEARNRYDGEGRVLSQLSPFGRRSGFRYLPGRVTIVDDDADGPVNSYVHDEAGRLVGAVDGHGAELLKAYDRRGNAVRVTDRDDSVITQEWDERSRLLRRVGADGSWVALGYDEVDRVVEVATSDGSVTRCRYDGHELMPSEVHDPEGGVTRLDVRAGLVHRVVDPDGVEVTVAYTSDGLPSSITDAAGGVTTIERDAQGRVTATVSPLGLRSELVYGDHDRPVERHDPGGGVWRYDWSPAGRLLAVTDPLGARREQVYGSHGSAEQLIDELGYVTTHRFDIFGNLVAIELPDGAKWQLGYDRLCRLISIDDPAGETWLREHDVVGRLVATIDPTGVRRTMDFDARGRITRIDDGTTTPAAVDHDEHAGTVTLRRADGTSVQVGRDKCGRTTSITDVDGHTTKFEYSPGSRLIAVTSPLGNTTHYEYDRCGRRSAVVDPLGYRWEHRYDADGRVVEIVGPAGETIRVRYDAAGRIAERLAPGGGVTRFERDVAGRLVAITDPTGSVTRYEYDPAACSSPPSTPTVARSAMSTTSAASRGLSSTRWEAGSSSGTTPWAGWSSAPTSWDGAPSGTTTPPAGSSGTRCPVAMSSAGGTTQRAGWRLLAPATNGSC